MISRLLVGAVTVALTPTTTMISFAVQYLVPDIHDDPAVRKMLAALDSHA
jgi:hypothetical protein